MCECKAKLEMVRRNNLENTGDCTRLGVHSGLKTAIL